MAERGRRGGLGGRLKATKRTIRAALAGRLDQRSEDVARELVDSALDAGDRRALLAALAYSEPPVAQAHKHKAGDVLVVKSAFGRAHDFAVVFGEDGIAHNVDAMTSRLLVDEAQAAGGEGRPDEMSLVEPASPAQTASQRAHEQPPASTDFVGPASGSAAQPARFDGGEYTHFGDLSPREQAAVGRFDDAPERRLSGRRVIDPDHLDEDI
jgi:hypothetical protein